jgi:hypothetical protein
MFGSIIWEHHRMKKEERELQRRMRELAELTRKTMGSDLQYVSLETLAGPVAHA